MVYSANEWDPLEQVIVGTATNMFWPEDYSNDWELVPSDGKIPQSIIDETNQALDNFVTTLKHHGVEVLRPIDQDYQSLNGFGAYSTRDTIAVIGDKVILSPTRQKFRQHEWNAIKPLFPEDSNFIYPPHDDHDLYFDAANIIRCNKDILYLISATGSEEGGLWLQHELGKEYTIHFLEGLYSGSHLDSTIIPIADGTVVLNAGRCKADHLPKFLSTWDQIWITDDDIIDYPNPLNIASKWIGMNIFCIAPKVCCVDADQHKLIDKLNNLGVTTIPVKFPYARYLLGGPHCTTLDTKRKKV